MLAARHCPALPKDFRSHMDVTPADRVPSGASSQKAGSTTSAALSSIFLRGKAGAMKKEDSAIIPSLYLVKRMLNDC